MPQIKVPYSTVCRDLSQDRVLQIFQEGSYVRKNDGAVVLHQFTYLDYCSFISEAQWGYKSDIKWILLKDLKINILDGTIEIIV